MAALSSAIANAMQIAQCPVQQRPFRGHLTLGHFTFNTRRHPFTLPPITTIEYPQFRINEIVLFQSELRADGSRYQPIETIKLLDT